MATIRKLFLHDATLGGVDTTLPAHLIGADKWRTQHNMRLTPGLVQIPKKVVEDTIGSADIRWIGALPTNTPGYGQVVLLTPAALVDIEGNTLGSGFSSDTVFRRWSTAIYAGSLYYINDLNVLQSFNGGTNATVSNAPKGRYLTFWYDHVVIGYPTVGGVPYPNRVQISGLDDFTDWTPTDSNEADFYDFVEWQQLDYPYVGVTGIAKLGGKLIVYTPTAVIPMSYVGLKKIFQVEDAGVVTRTGNTFPWTLVALGNVHFFYDAEEAMFLAYTGGQPEAIGEPVRQYMLDNLNTDIDLAMKMYGYVDSDYREIWWPFVSTALSGAFDKAVVFNYKYKKWYTASVENVLSFCSRIRLFETFNDLTGTLNALAGTFNALGFAGQTSPRIFGSASGKVLREEISTDDVGDLLAADDPVLESADFHYGDLRTVKENDAVVLNAVWEDHDDVVQNIEVRVRGREFLSTLVDWTHERTLVGVWTPQAIDGELNYPTRSGRVLRYRFKGINVRGLTFSAFSDRVRVEMPEK